MTNAAATRIISTGCKMRPAILGGVNLGKPVVKNLKDAENVRMNLKVPAEIKRYLYAAAYRESTPENMVSMTEYLCSIVRKDMESRRLRQG